MYLIACIVLLTTVVSIALLVYQTHCICNCSRGVIVLSEVKGVEKYTVFILFSLVYFSVVNVPRIIVVSLVVVTLTKSS